MIGDVDVLCCKDNVIDDVDVLCCKDNVISNMYLPSW